MGQLNRTAPTGLDGIGHDFNPLHSSLGWFTAAWASDPTWDPPESNGLEQISTWPGHGTDGADFVASAPATAGRVRYQESWADLNGRSAIEFSGSGVLDDTPVASFGASLAGSFSIVAVVSLDTTALGYITSASDGTRFVLSGSPQYWRYYTNDGNIPSAPDIPFTTGAHLVAGVATPSGTDKLYIDGTTQTGGRGHQPLPGLVVGANSAGVTRLDGAIGFVGVCEGDVLDASWWPLFVQWVSDYYGIAV